MRRVESTVDQSPEKMEKGESSLSQQAGDLLGRGANTLSTNADRAEASKALTKDGTLPDFQLDMDDSTSPSSPGASDSSLGDQVPSPSSDQQQDSRRDKGENTNSTSQGAGDASISAIPDNFDPNPEASGDSNIGGAPEAGGDSATNPANPGNSDLLPPAATAENSTSAPTSAAGEGVSIGGPPNSSDANPGSSDNASSATNPASSGNGSGSIGADEIPFAR